MPYAFEGGVCSDFRESAVAITDDDYLAALDGMFSGKVVSIVDGFKLIDAPIEAERDPESDLSLEQWKMRLTMKIDEDAERARLRYITGGSGQAMTYQQKAQEAAAALAIDASGGVPDPSDYHLLNAEIGITAPTLLGVATIIDNAYQTWRVVGAAIEALRLGGKALVQSATSIESAKQAASIVWP